MRAQQLGLLTPQMFNQNQVNPFDPNRDARMKSAADAKAARIAQEKQERIISDFTRSQTFARDQRAAAAQQAAVAANHKGSGIGGYSTNLADYGTYQGDGGGWSGGYNDNDTSYSEGWD